MSRSAPNDQVLYVRPRRGGVPVYRIYVRYTRKGAVEYASLDVQNSNAPAIKIQRKEYERLLRDLHLCPPARPATHDSDRQEQLRRSSQIYRDKIAELRLKLGIPLQRIPRGWSAPDSDVQSVLKLIDEINPETGRVYSGIEIAIKIGRSPSFVSRVKNGQRRVEYQTPVSLP